MVSYLHYILFLKFLLLRSARRFSDTDVVLDYKDSEFRVSPEGIITLTNKVFTTTYDQDKLESTNGVITSVLNSDGSGEIRNGGGFIRLQADGNLNLNGVIINPQGTVIQPAWSNSYILLMLTPQTLPATSIAASDSLTVDDVEMKEHKHKAGEELLDSGGNKCTGKTGEPDA